MAVLAQHLQNQVLDTLTPLRLYGQNSQMAAALLPDLHLLDIALRNKISARLGHAYSVD
jgi:hypothetical protein